jgi:hypothetical protein
MTEKEYRKHEGVNYSLLSKLSNSPVKLDEPQEDKNYFALGSLVDCLLTSPEDFRNQFYIMTVGKPSSDMMLSYANTYFETGDHAKALLSSGYKADPTVVAKSSKDGLSKWQKEGEPYYNALKQAGDKTVIDFELYGLANKMVNNIKDNAFTSKYFGGTDNLHQKAIVWEYNGVECKSLLDIIHFDDINQKIYPMDLKTTGKSVLSFERSYLDYKYYLQAAFYTKALEYEIEHGSLHKYQGYTIEPFKFIVTETGCYNPPHIFEVSANDLHCGEFGGELKRGYEIKGFKQLIEDLVYHKTDNQWDYKKEVYENNGIISLNSFC